MEATVHKTHRDIKKLLQSFVTYHSEIEKLTVVEEKSAKNHEPLEIISSTAMPTLSAVMHSIVVPDTDIMRKLASNLITIDLCSSAADTEISRKIHYKQLK